MPTVLLIDCSLNMVERFPFVIKQNEQMETTLNIEKRSLIAKFIESLMSQNRSLTRLEPIALIFFAGADTLKIIHHFTRNPEPIVKSVQKLPILGDFALKSAIEFSKKYLTTVFGAQRSQKILVFTDSSHRDEDFNNHPTTNDAMDVDLRHTHMNDDEIIVRKSYSQIEVSFICVRKPSGADRARIEDITKQLQCSLSKFYWLINREKETKSLITTDMIATMMNRVRNDTMNVFISTLKCGHYESQLAVYPTIKPATLQATGELLQPSNSLTVNGFIELSSIRSAMAISKHVLLPIQRYQKASIATPMFATKKSAAGNTPSSSATNIASVMQKKLNSANSFFYLLLICLKKEKTVALVSINDQWYGTIHSHKLDRKKKSSRLILSVFEPGDCIPWIPSFERLGPYALIFPSGPNGELAYKKQLWPVKPFPRSYTETFLIWCRQNNFQVTNLHTDLFQSMAISLNLERYQQVYAEFGKTTRESQYFPSSLFNERKKDRLLFVENHRISKYFQELNKICRGAFIYGLRERLFHLLQKLFQRQVELGKIKPEGVKYIQTAMIYMNRLSSSDRYIKFEDN